MLSNGGTYYARNALCDWSEILLCSTSTRPRETVCSAQKAESSWHVAHPRRDDEGNGMNDGGGNAYFKHASWKLSTYTVAIVHLPSYVDYYASQDLKL